MHAAQKPERLVLGLLSGTSVDAAEAALCRIRGAGDSVKLTLVGHHSVPISRELRRSVREAARPEELCGLQIALAECFAQAGLGLLAKLNIPDDSLDLVGSHGQTVAHLPPPAPFPSSLQLGEANVLSQRLGAPVVFDFRAADLAVGGQGAPLVPYFDWAILRGAGETRAFQNLGGIGNVSVVGDRLEDVLAFDTGPGNMLLDALAERVTEGALPCDRDGQLSQRGSADPVVLESLLETPYLKRPPPKSTGRELFGPTLLERVWAALSSRPYDALATAVAFTVEATARAYESYIYPRVRPAAMYVSGGGSRHPGLMAGLRRRLAPLAVHPLDVLGFPEAAKEAACFALLANECIMGVPQNVPSATGARAAVVLGKIVP
jgi:anhydro-N-acetylmuramic acid kinase